MATYPAPSVQIPSIFNSSNYSGTTTTSLSKTGTIRLGDARYAQLAADNTFSGGCAFTGGLHIASNSFSMTGQTVTIETTGTSVFIAFTPNVTCLVTITRQSDMTPNVYMITLDSGKVTNIYPVLETMDYNVVSSTLGNVTVSSLTGASLSSKISVIQM